MDEAPGKEKLCPKCGADIIMTTAWDGTLEPATDKCMKCGYKFKEPELQKKRKSVFKWSGS
ncbi:MAG: hypothetical protein HY516_03950 [Candidatus Aenigmarchaeota archaeon]|nr:hypothetical protein [Candidatus Aenigmarchaeota archaeon]